MINMIKGQGTSLLRFTSSKGKKYDTYYIYIPRNVATDSLYPFGPNERVNVTIDTENKKLIIEKIKKEEK